MKNKVYKIKVVAQGELMARTLDAAARSRNITMNSDEKHAIFANELQSALRLTVGFSVI